MHILSHKQNVTAINVNISLNVCEKYGSGEAMAALIKKTVAIIIVIIRKNLQIFLFSFGVVFFIALIHISQRESTIPE